MNIIFDVTFSLIVELSGEDNLIELRQKYPCLYDVCSKSYSDSNEKQKATNKTAEKLVTDTPNEATKSLRKRIVFEIN